MITSLFCFFKNQQLFSIILSIILFFAQIQFSARFCDLCLKPTLPTMQLELKLVIQNKYLIFFIALV